jgi:hypothetical protein
MCTAASWHSRIFRGFDDDRLCPNFNRHTPRKRGIQYAATSNFIAGTCVYWIVR